MQISGKSYWTKLDKLHDNYQKQKKILNKDTGEPDGWGREWSIEVGNLTLATKKALKEAGLLGRVRNKMDEREDFVTFRISEFKRDGEPNDQPPVVGPDTKPWDWAKNGLIGNGSDVTVKFNVWRGGAQASAFLVAVKVDNHLKYEAPSGGNDYEDPMNWGDPVAVAEKPKTGKNAKVDDLDDDIPV